MECRVKRIALDGKLAVPGNIVLPGQGGHALKQRFEIRCWEGAQLHQYPGAAAQIEIQTGNIGQRAFTVDPAVFRPDLGQIQPPHLIGHQRFQSQQAGNRQCHGLHPLIQKIKSFMGFSITGSAGLCNAAGKGL